MDEKKHTDICVCGHMRLDHGEATGLCLHADDQDKEDCECCGFVLRSQTTEPITSKEAGE